MMRFDPSVHTMVFFKELEKKHKGNRSDMAKELGISRKTLYKWINKASKSDNNVPKAVVAEKTRPVTKKRSIRKKTITTTKTTTTIDYDKFILYLEGHRKDVPFADVVLDRCEGIKKRDRSLVKAVLNIINHYYLKEVENIGKNIKNMDKK